MPPNELGKAKKRQATTRPDDASANVAPVVNSTRQREPNRLPLGASKVERIEWLARRFETIAVDLRLMREQDTKADHLLNNTHCKAVQATRLLFEAIDVGGLPLLWSPGVRPIEAGRWESQADGTYKPVDIPEDQLEPDDYRQAWAWAVSTLYQDYPEALPHGADCVELSPRNEALNFVGDVDPVDAPYEEEADRLDYYRRRAVIYADSCELLATLLRQSLMGSGPPKRQLRVVSESEISLDGERFTLSPREVRLFVKLIQAGGEWITADHLRENEEERMDRLIRGTPKDGRRTGGLPKELQGIIESCEGKGYRLKNVTIEEGHKVT